ncbi:hypothetical protein COO60DRAFT_1076306 [Scenedesmus sp. NREL 46B-D3]|nr:hypothetical protein COO60DRAFT_1076306 [Scenedesmus sp. NREL 46B-D3]
MCRATSLKWRHPHYVAGSAASTRRASTAASCWRTARASPTSRASRALTCWAATCGWHGGGSCWPWRCCQRCCRCWCCRGVRSRPCGWRAGAGATQQTSRAYGCGARTRCCPTPTTRQTPHVQQTWSAQPAGASASPLAASSDGCAGGDYEGLGALLAHRYRLMMALAVGLPLLQQASGINTVVYYSSKVFASAGLSSPVVASIITGGVNLAVTLAAAALLDRCGRKPLLLVSYIGMAAALGAVAGLGLLPVSAGTAGVLMVLLVLLYVACFAVGSGPVTWVVLSEVLPPAIKGPAASLATAAAWTDI